MPNYANFKPAFDELATGGCIGATTGRLAYAYLRVSGSDQAEEGRSGLPRQMLHIHEVAQQAGFRIPWQLVFADDHTGFEFESRPALSRLRQEYKQPHRRRASAIVMEHLDRLSRNVDWHQGFLLDEMRLAQIQPLFWRSFGSRIERTVLGVIAQDGMEQSFERMRQGNLNKAKSGRVTARVAAFGYRLVVSTRSLVSRLATKSPR